MYNGMSSDQREREKIIYSPVAMLQQGPFDSHDHHDCGDSKVKLKRVYYCGDNGGNTILLDAMTQLYHPSPRCSYGISTVGICPDVAAQSRCPNLTTNIKLSVSVVRSSRCGNRYFD